MIDGEQQVALLDGTAVAEVHLIDIAGDAGTDLNAFRRLEAAGELVPLSDPAGEWRRDGHLGLGALRVSHIGRGHHQDSRQDEAGTCESSGEGHEKILFGASG